MQIPQLVLIFAVTCTVSSVVAGALDEAATCLYPCIDVNGCVCNQSVPLEQGGQNFGTCSACAFGWTGADCTIVSTMCYNGGTMQRAADNSSLGCKCQPGWQGVQCERLQCINSENGVGPDHIAPVNSSNMCEDCLPGYTGLSCSMCTTDEQCPVGERCISSPIAVGQTKSLYCELTDPYWVALIADDRPGVKAYATMFCNSSAPLRDVSPALGACYTSVWRLEQEAAWFDPFFFCSTENCSMTVTKKVVTTTTSGAVPANAAAIRYVWTGVMYFILVLMIANGFVSTRSDCSSQGRVRRFGVLSTSLAIALVGYIVFCNQYGHAASGSSREEDVVEYECLRTKCVCAPNPPPHHQYVHCNGSVMDEFFFPFMVGKFKVQCTMDGVCSISQENLGYIPIALQCVAAECTSSNASIPVGQDLPPDEEATTVVVWAMVGGTLLASGLFVLRSIRSATQLAASYLLLANDNADAGRSVTQSGVAINEVQPSRRLSGIQLDLKDSHYVVAGREVLCGVSLSCCSGETVAIVGSSGAGKTTLLDILSCQAKVGNVSGSLCVNGTLVTASNGHLFRRLVGYVPQTDNLLPSLTVREMIEFSARLKLPAAVPREAIKELVEDVISKLGLSRCADTLIGNQATRGISGGEKRRVAIGAELVALPRILILDEPTSGLDSVSALEVIRVVSNLSRSPLTASRSGSKYFLEIRPAVVFSIHQPSAEIAALFDRLVVVSQGMILYSGPAKHALSSIAAAAKHDSLPPSLVAPNPIDAILRLAFEASPAVTQKLAAAAKTSSLISNEQTPIPQKSRDILAEVAEHRKYHPNAVQQFLLLSERSWCSLMGSYYLIMCHAFATLAMGIFLSLLYHKEKLDLAGTEDMAGMVTLLLFLVAFSSISCLDLFISEKRLYVIERDNGCYGAGPYYLTKLIFDFVPLRILQSAVLAAVIYYPLGLRQDSGSPFVTFIGVLVLFQLLVTSICLCIATLCPTFGAGALCSSLVILWHSAFGGLITQSSRIPHGLVWCKYLSPFYFAYEALMVTVLDGLTCTFNPRGAHGQPGALIVPLPCRQFLFNDGLNPAHFSRDVSLMFVWFFAYVVLGAILTFLQKAKV